MQTPSAKDIRVAPIDRKAADAAIKRWHYSGKVVNNSQLSLGVFIGDRLLGAMQFGPSLDKRKVSGLVAGTGWNEFIELNRMAFGDELPRNSESRALGVALRMIRKQAPQIKWVVSFADGAQCGDRTIYRAAGFVLTAIKRNNSLWSGPDGDVSDDITVKSGKQKAPVFSRTSLTDGRSKDVQRQAPALAASAVAVNRTTLTKGSSMVNGAASMKHYAAAGFKPIPGFQLRYVYFIDPTYRPRLTVAEIPFSKIAEVGATMYKGQRPAKGSPDGTTIGEGGSIPTAGLHVPPNQ